MTLASTFKAADANGYEMLMGRWSRQLAVPFLDFVGAADGESVLDVGCGTGRLTFELVERCNLKQVQGVDLADVYVEHARSQNRDPRVRFDVGDACALPYPDRSYDRVLSLLMLHFVPRADQAVAEMRRVARPGAVVACGRVGCPRGFRRDAIVLRHGRRARSEGGRTPGPQLYPSDDPSG